MLILLNNGVQKCPEICLHEPFTCATKLERKKYNNLGRREYNRTHVHGVL